MRRILLDSGWRVPFFLVLVLGGYLVFAAEAPTNELGIAGANRNGGNRPTNPLEVVPSVAEGPAGVFLTFGLNRLPFLQGQVWGNPLWQYVASLTYLFLAFYLSKFVDFVIRSQLKRWAQKTKTKFDDYLIQLLHGPVKVICFVILLHIGLRIFSWPEWFNAYLSKALKIVVATSITYVALKFVDLLMDYWRSRAVETEKSLNDQLYPLARKTLKVFLIVVAVLVTSQNLGINITGILASFSVGALAVGLAAQDTLANLFGAVAIYLDRPFKTGDRIRLEGGPDGTVETIGLRSTRVRSLEGFLVTVPNKTMGNATITNITERPTIKTTINLGLTYDTTIDQLKRALVLLNEIFRNHPMTHNVTVAFTEFANSSLNIQVVHWWKSTDYNAYLEGMQEFNLSIMQRFAEAGLEFAYPTQTLIVKPAPPA